jgi:hypothetical protein
LAHLRRRGVAVVWTLPDESGVMATTETSPSAPLEALAHRLAAARRRARARLRGDGVDVQ